MSRDKLRKSEIFKIGPFLIILILIVGWIFSGWPRIWQKPPIPPQPQEARAAAPAGIIVAWPNASSTIPAGWYRDPTLDGYFLIGTSTDPGFTGGSATHTHTIDDHTHTQNSHTHAATSTTVSVGTGVSVLNTADRLINETHTHSIAQSDATTAVNQNATGLTSDSASSAPPYREVIWIYSDGTAEIPNGAIAYFDNSTLPTNWNATTTALFHRGAPASTDPVITTQGTTSHTHTSSHNHTQNSHTHTTPTATGSNTEDRDQGTGTTGASPSAHTHTVAWTAQTATNQAQDANIQNTSVWPPYYGLVAVQNETGSAETPTNIIAAWRGTIANIPSDWKLCDGTNSTPDLRDRFINATSTANLDKTGGSASHTHTAAVHTHIQDPHAHILTIAGAVTATKVNSTGYYSAPNTHTHPDTTSATTTPTNQDFTVTVNTNTDSRPPFYGVAYIQYQLAPTTLTLTIDSADPTNLGTVFADVPVTATTRLNVNTNNTSGYYLIAGRNNIVNSDTLFSAYGNLTIDDATLPVHTTACNTPAAWVNGSSKGLGFTVYDASGGGKNTTCWGSGSTETGANNYAAFAASASATTILTESDNSPNPSYVSVGYKLDVTSIQTATTYNDGQVIFTATTN